jgi:hypothetical protein
MAAGSSTSSKSFRNLRAASQCSYAVYGTEIIIATGPELIVTPINYHLAMVPALFYAVLTTFWLQSPADRRAGLATAAYIKSTSGCPPRRRRPAIRERPGHGP